MKVEYLINQAKKYLPLLSDNFTDNIDIKEVDVKDGLFTVTLEKNLNIKIGEEAIFFVRNIPTRIDIESITKIKDDEAILITKQNHNQTKDPEKDYHVFINIQNCLDELYNKKTEILEDYQDGGFKLRIKVDKKATDSPDTSNAFFYIHNYYKGNGIKRVKIIDKNVFSFQEEDHTLNYKITDFPGMSIAMNTRVYPAYDFIDAKSQFNRNLQAGIKEDKINKISEPILKMKKTDQFTAFISLNVDTQNTAANDTSVGLYHYLFSVYIFVMHRDVDKYKVRDLEDILLHKVFNKIFGEKIITLNDNILSINRTSKIKFVKSNFAEQRENDLSVFDFQYEFTIQTFIDDYNLPKYDVRLNEINMEVTNNDSLNYSKVHILL